MYLVTSRQWQYAVTETLKLGFILSRRCKLTIIELIYLDLQGISNGDFTWWLPSPPPWTDAPPPRRSAAIQTASRTRESAWGGATRTRVDTDTKSSASPKKAEGNRKQMENQLFTLRCSGSEWFAHAPWHALPRCDGNFRLFMWPGTFGSAVCWRLTSVNKQSSE